MAPASPSGVLRSAAQDDQPTVISNRPPVLPISVSDSAKRILQGQLLAGDRLGHFELAQYVGGGGMGKVFRAQDTRLARTVAIKILPPDQAADRETLQRFQNEAQSAARLSHENIVRVYYVGEDQDLHYIVFEFIEGVNIRELVEAKGPLPLAEAISYTLQAADALAHAAGRNVVHRDIKPSNLLITPDGRVKLIDMGLARLRESDQAADLTASGVTLGTFDYISPEQARDPRCADVRSDVYSLGCTLFYMLTGQPPFPGGTVLQKLLQHQGDQPPDVKTFRPDLPDGLTHVLRKMLAKDPRHRYRVPADLVDDLLLLAKEVGAVPLALGGRSWIPPREPARSVVWQHLPWILPLVALVAIVFALDFYWSRTPQDGTPPFPERPVSGLSQQNADSHISTDNGAKPSAAKTVARPTLPPSPAKPAEPPEEATAVKPSAKRVGVLVVGSPAEGESSFSTLGAACRAAADGDVIELRYDGPRVEQPLKLENLRLTVRAADGFRPVVLFQPGKEERNMWTLTGGRLTLINVVLEMQIPRDSPADARSLFEGRASPALRLERCSLTIRNVTDPLHTDVAFVRVKPALADEPLLGYRTLAEPASLELVNSVVRGEAVLLRVEDSQPARLAWDNGLLVTSEWLLSATGATTGSRNGGVEPLRIDLRHVTAIMRRGLCRLTSDVATPRHLAAQINCTDSILVGGGGSVLLEQVGDEGPNELRQQIAWNGDRNMYDSFDAFWVLRRSDRETPPVLMGFEAWKSHWGPRENLPQCEKVEWQRAPAAILPLHRRTPADYTLSATDGNPALGTASDGRNLGCQADRLPGLFQEAASENPLPEMLDPEPFELDPSPGGKAGKPVPDSSAIRRPKRLSG